MTMEDTDILMNEIFQGMDDPQNYQAYDAMHLVDDVMGIGGIAEKEEFPGFADNSFCKEFDFNDLADLFCFDELFEKQDAKADTVTEIQPFGQADSSTAAVSCDAFSDSESGFVSETSPESAESSPASRDNDDYPQVSLSSIIKKRQQNREAAKRYRMKKKCVTSCVVEEEQVLEMENSALRKNIDCLEAKLSVIKEILYHQFGFPPDGDIVMVQL